MKITKRAYRPVPSSTPSYPRLVDVNRRSVLDWGLVALGGLWLGSAGCSLGRTSGTPVAARVADAGAVDARVPKAAGPDTRPTPVAPTPLHGVMVQPRLPHGEKAVQHAGKPVSPRIYDAEAATPKKGTAEESKVESPQAKKSDQPKQKAKRATTLEE